MFRQKGTFVRR